MLGEVGEEGDDVVAGLALDRLDALDFEPAALPQRGRRFRRDDADGRLRVAGMCLDLEPEAEAVGRLPDPAHRGAAVAGDHREASSMADCLGEPWLPRSGNKRRAGGPRPNPAYPSPP